ncbi:rho-related BTB domain-containing protein 1 isoform X4 [Ixodes scapularis]|uniref:rho-related BTB domain-containing protein 1 isoform X4 n=1 Tax=Ixodes scapularis TaxID=6945 RepID=UPI001C382309|nr:rho-related BTB domain-containing protein 1 isoform X4 [Ixodes scapularis]
MCLQQSGQLFARFVNSFLAHKRNRPLPEAASRRRFRGHAAPLGRCRRAHSVGRASRRAYRRRRWARRRGSGGRAGGRTLSSSGTCGAFCTATGERGGCARRQVTVKLVEEEVRAAGCSGGSDQQPSRSLPRDQLAPGFARTCARAARAVGGRLTRSLGTRPAFSSSSEGGEDQWPPIMSHEQPHQELVKCVVVGDTGVGKTRLICAKACNTKVSLPQLMTTHIPTVWAIDQYRIYKDVLERSWEVVDSVSVSLRLWDTFGDHDKDRRFAYGRSDVVLLCFSIANEASLTHCKTVWYPEIRRFCPDTPIILVGCKNDLRHMYRDEEFLSLCRDRSPFFRPLRVFDILPPEKGRAVAFEIGACYYETSVLTLYGVSELFENVIRAALVSRKQHHFWMTNLKHVLSPQLQAPFCPPMPELGELVVPPSQFEEHMEVLFNAQAYTDAIFVSEGVGIPAHRWLLAAMCSAFQQLFTCDIENQSLEEAESISDASMESSLDSSQESENGDAEQAIAERQLPLHSLFRLTVPYGSDSAVTNCVPVRHRDSCQRYPEGVGQASGSLAACPAVVQNLNYLPFTAADVGQCERLGHRGGLVVVLATQAVTSAALQECLRFLYTGRVDLTACPVAEIQEAASLISVPELMAHTNNIRIQEGGETLNTELVENFLKKRRSRLKDVCLNESLFSDVLFQLDDGFCSAHRALLMARCDMMAAMFRGDFRESSAKVVHFPGARRECFERLLTYLYTDSVSDIMSTNECLDLIELANRLCLPRLICLMEQKVISELTALSSKDADAAHVLALTLLEPSQIHNADQLADWCLHHIAINHEYIKQQHKALLRSLHPENQAYLNQNQWPPTWYNKEMQVYERFSRVNRYKTKAKKLSFCPFSFRSSKAPKQLP